MAERSLPDAFIAALQSLAGWLTASQIPHTTIGGVAVSLIANPRATQDIDVLIWLEEAGWETLLTDGNTYGFEARINDVLEFAKKSRVLLLRHSDSAVSVDISCGALPFEREIIERSNTLDIGGHQLRVPTPEDLIITKAVAHRPKDLADIESILSITPSPDLERIRYWVRQFADVLETPELFESLEKLLAYRHNRSNP